MEGVLYKRGVRGRHQLHSQGATAEVVDSYSLHSVRSQASAEAARQEQEPSQSSLAV